MKARLRILAALFILLFVPLRADSLGGGSVRGQILPGPGESDLPGIVMVRILGAGLQQVTFVSGGFFSFSGLPDGNYTIHVTSNGREETVTDLPNWSSNRSDVVTITMGQRISDESVPPAGNAVVDLKTLRVPEKAHEELQKGLQCLDKTEFEKAQKHFEAAIKIFPEFYQAHNNLAIAHMRQNRLDDAEKEFAEAVRIHSENPTGLKNLAYIRMNLGRPKDAIDPLAKAVRLDTNDATAQMYLGEAYALTENPAGAKDHFMKAALLNPALAHPHYRLGYIFLDEKEYAEALEHFQAFLKLDPPKGKEEVAKVVAELDQHLKDSHARTTPNVGF